MKMALGWNACGPHISLVLAHCSMFWLFSSLYESGRKLLFGWVGWVTRSVSPTPTNWWTLLLGEVLRSPIFGVKMFTVLETVIHGLHFLLCNLLDIFAPWPRKWGSSGPCVVYTLPNVMHFANGWFWFSRKLLTIVASKLKNALPPSLYIFAGKDATNYFRSQANRIIVIIFRRVWVAISRQWFNRFPKNLQFLKLWFNAFILGLCNLLNIFALWPRTIGAHVALPSLRVT